MKKFSFFLVLSLVNACGLVSRDEGTQASDSGIKTACDDVGNCDDPVSMIRFNKCANRGNINYCLNTISGRAYIDCTTLGVKWCSVNTRCYSTNSGYLYQSCLPIGHGHPAYTGGGHIPQ